jgi:hypothetical protein
MTFGFVHKRSNKSGFGFSRVPSPAQKRLNRLNAARRARRIIDPQIESVDSVDKGAGVGCEVVFRKHETERDQAMSDFEWAIEEQKYAEAQYPELSKYAALSKWLSSDIGKRINAQRNREIYAREQKRTAVGNGYESAGVGNHLAWAGAVQGGVGYKPDNGAKVDGVNSSSAADTPVGKSHPNLVTKENIDVLMKRYGLSFDSAATLLARGGGN